MDKDMIVVPEGENSDALTLRCNNWPKAFPYTPEVKVKLWHDDANLYINYEVDEEFVRALASSDNGDVYKDSCAEFFIAFDNNGYYNLESNCAGKVLLSHRLGRKENVEYASPEILAGIKREPSLGHSPFECKKAEGKWSMTLQVPASTFFKHSLNGFKGMEARCNIYKCGDELPRPHFLSYFPITTENPDFHRPEFFGKIKFS